MYEFGHSAAANSMLDAELPPRVSLREQDVRLVALDDDALDAWNERVAICMVDGGLSEEEAEAVAWQQMDAARAAHFSTWASCMAGYAGRHAGAGKGEEDGRDHGTENNGNEV